MRTVERDSKGRDIIIVTLLIRMGPVAGRMPKTSKTHRLAFCPWMHRISMAQVHRRCVFSDRHQLF